MTSDDVIAGSGLTTLQVSAGQLGGMPAVPGQRLNASIIVQSLLKTPEEFGAIPLRNNPDGSIVRVRDVGRVELGTEFDNARIRYNGHPASGLAIRRRPGPTRWTPRRRESQAGGIVQILPARDAGRLPLRHDSLRASSHQRSLQTLIEAIFLVFLVMFLFLGNMRATLIPTIAVPVVILGTFGVLGLFGYSINMLTMFAMVLAIGLLVDDAIVVVENVERIMSEEGLSPLEATGSPWTRSPAPWLASGLSFRRCLAR